MRERSCRNNLELKGEIVIFGFGSFFEGKNVYQDIDLLVLHKSKTKEAYNFAISCKKYIFSKIPCAHITILSRRGESQQNFIQQSNAIFLGEVYDESCFDLLDTILDKHIQNQI